MLMSTFVCLSRKETNDETGLRDITRQPSIDWAQARSDHFFFAVRGDRGGLTTRQYELGISELWTTHSRTFQDRKYGLLPQHRSRRCDRDRGEDRNLSPTNCPPTPNMVGDVERCADFSYWDRESSVSVEMIQLSLFSAGITSELGTSALDRLY